MLLVVPLVRLGRLPHGGRLLGLRHLSPVLLVVVVVALAALSIYLDRRRR